VRGVVCPREPLGVGGEVTCEGEVITRGVKRGVEVTPRSGGGIGIHVSEIHLITNHPDISQDVLSLRICGGLKGNDLIVSNARHRIIRIRPTSTIPDLHSHPIQYPARVDEDLIDVVLTSKIEVEPRVALIGRPYSFGFIRICIGRVTRVILPEVVKDARHSLGIRRVAFLRRLALRDIDSTREDLNLAEAKLLVVSRDLEANVSP